MGNQWDIICVIKHKDHMNVGSIPYIKGYHLFYVRIKVGQYNVVSIIIVDKDQLRVVTSDIVLDV